MKKTRLYPHRIAKIISWFIPLRRNRHHFLMKHDKKNYENYLACSHSEYGGKQSKEFDVDFRKILDYELSKGAGKERETRKSRIRKLIKYKALFDYLDQSYITIANEEILLDSLLAKRDFILLISHEFSLTGAPIALQRFAKVLLKLGKCPWIISHTYGDLYDVIAEEGIPVSVIPDIRTSSFIENIHSLFSLIIVNTLDNSSIILKLLGLKTPVLWWIHEAKASYECNDIGKIPQTLSPNIRVYCVGEYASKIFAQHFSYIRSDVLLYYIPEENSSFGSDILYGSGNKKKKFACIGTIDNRKAQHILCDAIMQLGEEEISECTFYFIGKIYEEDVFCKIDKLLKIYPGSVRYLGVLQSNEVQSIYKQIDCLICSSKDDPMPIVVTEAWMNSKIVICSEYIGSASLIQAMNAGLIYRNNDSKELARCIKMVIDGEVDEVSTKTNGRKLYERYFTEEVFINGFEKIYREFVCREPMHIDGKVSVIIPTYNGLKDLKELVPVLKIQNGLTELEIIFVDSGSNDGTIDFAEVQGINVIRIKQSDFSHSYARNLGAKTASGKYLLFMTQDALPNGKNWILKMLQPILRNEAVAVSCVSLPKPNCCLFGKICLWSHYKYLDVLNKDRILFLPSKCTPDSIRRNAQLDDVACLITKDLFDKYQYNGNYAEDLDLGIRLIKDNHYLAILHSTQVFHSHTRSSFYHLKHAIVDTIHLNRLLSISVSHLNQLDVINQIISEYLFIKSLLELYKNKRTCKSFDEVVKDLSFISERSIDIFHSKSIIDDIQFESTFFDKETVQFFFELYTFIDNTLTIVDEKEFKFWVTSVLNHTLDYIKDNNIPFYDTFEKEFYEDVLVKSLSTKIGNLLGNYWHETSNKEDIFCKFIKKYIVGI